MRWDLGEPDDDPAQRLWSLWQQGYQPRVEDFLEAAGVRDPERSPWRCGSIRRSGAGWGSGSPPSTISTPSPPSGTTPSRRST